MINIYIILIIVPSLFTKKTYPPNIKSPLKKRKFSRQNSFLHFHFCLPPPPSPAEFSYTPGVRVQKEKETFNI